MRVADSISLFAPGHSTTSMYMTRRLLHSTNGSRRMPGCLRKVCSSSGACLPGHRLWLRWTWTTAKACHPTVGKAVERANGAEVASTYSPNNPAARDDLGTMAAQRQGELADNLYPFKLVYDDGTERLACDSARDRGKSLMGPPWRAELMNQYDGSMPSGMLLSDLGVDRSRRLAPSDRSDLFQCSLAAKEAGRRRLSIRPSQAVRRPAHQVPGQSSRRHIPCTPPMIKSS